jgi:hypothetical protein
MKLIAPSLKRPKDSKQTGRKKKNYIDKTK